jgi:hypothetical protein
LLEPIGVLSEIAQHTKHTKVELMKWYVVYRKDNTGIWRACAFFLFHNDGKNYVDYQNQLEPGCYNGVLEQVPGVSA